MRFLIFHNISSLCSLINANNYEAKDIIKIIREWTELSQTKFGQTINRGRDSINNIESGRNRMYLNDFLEMCKTHNITVTLEKAKK